MKRILWNSYPTIGFWIENDPVRFYYGVDLTSIDNIAKRGIVAPDHGWIELSIDPITAIEPTFEACLVVDLPTRWMMERMDQRLRGNPEYLKSRLLNKDLYTKWTRLDIEYYASLQIHIANVVPSRYIIGFMVKH